MIVVKELRKGSFCTWPVSAKCGSESRKDIKKEKTLLDE